MSTYIHFFMKIKDNFIPITSYTSSSNYYEFFNKYAPYEKIKNITEKDIEDIRLEVTKAIADIEHDILVTQHEINDIRLSHNSMKEKLEVITEFYSKIEEFKDEIKSLEEIQSFTHFLGDLISEAYDLSRYGNNSLFENNFNYNEYIYVGIECGYPTVEDIEKED